MEYRPTRTGGDGVGYYRGSDGRMYYGSPQHGFALTQEEQAKDEAARQAQADAYRQQQAAPRFRAAVPAPGPLSQAAGAAGAMLGAGLLGTGLMVGAALLLLGSVFSSWSTLLYWAKKEPLKGVELVLLIALLLLCAYRTWQRRSSWALLYWVLCLVVSVGAESLILLFARQPITGGALFTWACRGVSLGALPAFLLQFWAHLCTKQERGDREWFITKVSRFVCRHFWLRARGVALFGLMSLAFRFLFASVSGLGQYAAPSLWLAAACFVMAFLGRNE